MICIYDSVNGVILFISPMQCDVIWWSWIILFNLYQYKIRTQLDVSITKYFVNQLTVIWPADLDASVRPLQSAHSFVVNVGFRGKQWILLQICSYQNIDTWQLQKLTKLYFICIFLVTNINSSTTFRKLGRYCICA